jgi:hypothetical protein
MRDRLRELPRGQDVVQGGGSMMRLEIYLLAMAIILTVLLAFWSGTTVC